MPELFDIETEAPFYTGGDGQEDHLGHVYCPCDPDHALCGVDVSSQLEVDIPGDYTYTPCMDDCAVCLDLERVPCERCDYDS